MRDKRITEQRNPRSSRIDLLSSIEIVDLINSEDETVATVVAKERDAIVMGRLGVGRQEATSLLDGAEGYASRVVGDLL